VHREKGPFAVLTYVSSDRPAARAELVDWLVGADAQRRMPSRRLGGLDRSVHGDPAETLATVFDGEHFSYVVRVGPDRVMSAVDVPCSGEIVVAPTLCGVTARCPADGHHLALDEGGVATGNSPCLSAVRRIEHLAERERRRDPPLPPLAALLTPPSLGEGLACTMPGPEARASARRSILGLLRARRLADCREAGDYICPSGVRRTIETMRIDVEVGCVEPKEKAFLVRVETTEATRTEWTYYQGVWRVLAGLPKEIVGGQRQTEPGRSAGDLDGDGVPELLTGENVFPDGGPVHRVWRVVGAARRDPVVVLEVASSDYHRPEVLAATTEDGPVLVVLDELRVWSDGRFVPAPPTAHRKLREALVASQRDYEAVLRWIDAPPEGWRAVEHACADPLHRRIAGELFEKLRALDAEDPESLGTATEIAGVLSCPQVGSPP
jgi:hypothetical protein